MGFQSQKPLEPKGKASSPFTKAHLRFECWRGRICWLVRANCILLGLRSESVFFRVRCERHVINRVSLTLITQTLTRALIFVHEIGCFSAAREFNRGLATANTALSRLGGKANAIFSKRGLIHFGNHFNAWSFSCFAQLQLLLKLVWAAVVLSADVYRWGRCSLKGVWFCEWRSRFPPSRIEFHFIEKNKRPSGGSDRMKSSPLLNFIYLKFLI